MAFQGPNQIRAVLETRNRARIEDGAGGGIEDVDVLGAAGVVPIQAVERDLVSAAVGEVEVDGEAGKGVPAGCDAIGRSGLLCAAGDAIGCGARLNASPELI